MSDTRVLKNISSVSVSTNSHGKIFTIKPKSSLTIKDSQADQIAEDLLYRYGFLKDITPPPSVYTETVEVVEPNHKGRMVKKTKKVVNKAYGKRGDSR